MTLVYLKIFLVIRNSPTLYIKQGILTNVSPASKYEYHVNQDFWDKIIYINFVTI